MPQTIELHRVFTAPPERLFRAFTIPEAMVKWSPPHGFYAKMQSYELKVGSGYKMSFHNLSNQESHSFGGTYREIKTNELLCYSDRFDDPNLAGEMLVTVKFKKVACGTELWIKQEGIPDVIPREMCFLGWQQSLQLLSQLVDAEVNGP